MRVGPCEITLPAEAILELGHSLEWVLDENNAAVVSGMTFATATIRAYQAANRDTL
jgi:hypothetical protein